MIVVLLTLIPSALGGCRSSASSDGALTDREFLVAVTLARYEAKTSLRSVVGASATVGHGTVSASPDGTNPSNTGHGCTSGTLLNIKVIGLLNPGIVHADVRPVADSRVAGAPNTRQETSPAADDAQAIVVTADPVSGFACQIGVQYADASPDPGATVLF